MSRTLPLLIELGTEELPPKALPELAQAFYVGIVAGLGKRGIAIDAALGKALYSPRRLAVLLQEVPVQQPNLRQEVFGPYLNIGLDAQGEPTAALRGFAQKNGLEVAQLEKTSDAKGERFVARSEKPGAATSSLLIEIIDEALKALPIPKPMRWGSRDIGFVRPAHWLVLLLGEQVVEGEVLGLPAGRLSRGHRFHHPDHVAIVRPEEYVDSLREAHVLVDADERRACLRTEIEVAAKQADGVARLPDELVEEVNCLVEWPQAVLCGFEPEFLRVPQEALISTMEANQKFFPVLNHEHRLTERFIGIANIDSRDVNQVRKGYERVIRPRFADAQFFYDEDLKQGLESMRTGLASVTYQQKLGSYADKSARVAALAVAIAEQVGVDTDDARRAAELAKADLQSRMVGEFPELQGIMGRYYASAKGETGPVADAIDHAYQPRFAGDAIAQSKLGQVLAIAERLDTLAGGFAAGLKPTGSKDAFALRRNGLGLARTLLEGGHDLSLAELVSRAVELQPIKSPSGQQADLAMHEICEFVYDRLRNYYAEQGVSGQHFDAVFDVAHESLPDFDQRLKAIGVFANLPEAPALAAANKRIRNILKKTDDAIPDSVNPALLSEVAERDLHAAVGKAIADTDPLLAKRDYVGVLSRLSQLRPQVD
ncbi:MAG TPA: glycine--tRNA ligase subunit beta, partial [Luteimonas sp.]|nr:glycine--tRNA ligase subunit beta [Luteimonas sp.]